MFIFQSGKGNIVAYVNEVAYGNDSDTYKIYALERTEYSQIRECDDKVKGVMAKYAPGEPADKSKEISDFGVRMDSLNVFKKRHAAWENAQADEMKPWLEKRMGIIEAVEKRAAEAKKKSGMEMVVFNYTGKKGTLEYRQMLEYPDLLKMVSEKKLVPVKEADKVAK
jgi:hypothetical protein